MINKKKILIKIRLVPNTFPKIPLPKNSALIGIRKKPEQPVSAKSGFRV